MDYSKEGMIAGVEIMKASEFIENFAVGKTREITLPSPVLQMVKI